MRKTIVDYISKGYSMVSEKIVKDAESLMKQKCEEKRKAGTLSKVHEESHMSAVATFGAATGRALLKGQKGWNIPVFNSQQGVEAISNTIKIAGYLHDCEREATEKVPHGEASARFVLKYWKENWKKPVKIWEDSEGIWPEDLGAIYKAIKYHEGSLNDTLNRFGNPLNITQSARRITTSIVAHSIVAGDKAFEASGYRVLERRSCFVGKERTDPTNEKADLKMFKYPEESHLTVLGETMIRLYAKNPIDSYPDWLKLFAQEWHSIQYQFYRGLLDYNGFEEADAANFFFEKNFPKFDQKLVDQIKVEQHLSGRFFAKEKYPILAGEIEKLNDNTDDVDDLANSSHLLVEDIATADNPEAAISKYKYINPLNMTLKNYVRFFDGIIAYREGKEEFVKEIEEKIRVEVEKIANK